MYLSATAAQVRNQFFAALDRFRYLPAFAGWQCLETEVRNPAGGFLFGRASDVSDRVVKNFQLNGSELLISFVDGSTIKVKIAESNTAHGNVGFRWQCAEHQALGE
jgi:hypothetical protein